MPVMSAPCWGCNPVCPCHTSPCPAVSIVVLARRGCTDHSKHGGRSHNLQKDEVEEGVHYKLMGIRDVCVVGMVKIGEQVTFRVLEE